MTFRFLQIKDVKDGRFFFGVCWRSGFGEYGGEELGCGGLVGSELEVNKFKV